MANDLIENEIAASDYGFNNSWNGIINAEGLQRLMELVFGKRIVGNYYSDYDGPEEGCNDTNDDGFCDMPRNISSGTSVDLYPSVAPLVSEIPVKAPTD